MFTLYKRAGRYGYDRYGFKNEDELIEYIKRHFFDESLSESILPRNAKKIKATHFGTDYTLEKSVTDWKIVDSTKDGDELVGKLVSPSFLRTWDNIEVVDVDQEYKPKRAKEVKVLQGYYDLGWEDLVTYSQPYDYQEIKDDLKSYRDNEKRAFRVITRRVPIKDEALSEAFDMNSVEFKDASADEDAMYGIEKHKNENRYFAVAVNNKTHESIMSQNSYDLGWSMRQVLKSVRANLHYDEGSSIDDWSFYKYTNEDVSPIVIDKTFFNYKGYTIEPSNNEWEITSPDGKKDYVPIDPADEDGGWGKAKEFVDGIVGESLSEDTIKQGSQWVNKGKEGTHGKFKTKKAADAQRRAMFAKGFSVNESVDPNTLSDDYVLLDSRARNHTDKDIDLYYDCIKEFCMIDEIVYEDMEVTFTANQRDADDWDEETFKTDYTYSPDEESALECANDYLVKKYPEKITVGDIKKSADDVYEEVKDFFYEKAQKEAEEKSTLSDFQEQLKEDKAKETMKSVVAKWRSRRSNKSAD